jgi:hypothetical protein
MDSPAFDFLQSDRADHSPAILRITKHWPRARLEQRPNTIFLPILDQTFSLHRASDPEHAFESFTRKVPGYLQLHIGIRHPGDPSGASRTETGEYPILGGSFVSTWAKCVGSENGIDGIMLDPTRTVVRRYVTALPMTVFCNVRIPIAFARAVQKQSSCMKCSA